MKKEADYQEKRSYAPERMIFKTYRKCFFFFLFPLLEPYWTHILFTWTNVDGLKVYINGTLSAEDKTGNVSENYGDPHTDLVIGTSNRDYRHYVTGAFDEFVIWERALTPNEILLYYSAAIGRTSWSISKYFLSF